MADVNQNEGLGDYVERVMLLLAEANQQDENDPAQKNLTGAIQKYREMLLNIATRSYLEKPGNPKLLEGLISLLGQIDKSVRDDRKEEAKKVEREDNKVSFNQMVEAMKMITNGTLAAPSWGDAPTWLDASDSDIDLSDIKIKDAELDLGRIQLDLDGNVV